MAKHGLSKTRVYAIWKRMRGRCSNQNDKTYKYYGGRGIRVCEEWKNPVVFYRWAMTAGYNDNLSIERVDNDGGYSPSNCTWATMAEQANNKRTSRKVTIDGKTLTLTQWCKLNGIKPAAAFSRMQDGWTIERAVTTEIKKQYPSRGLDSLTFNGKTLPVHEWAKIYSLNIGTIKNRILVLKWDIEKALLTPSRNSSKSKN